MEHTGYIYLSALNLAFRDAEQWADGVQNDSLKDVAASFKRIVSGIRTTIHLPPALVGIAMRVERAKTEAFMRVIGKPFPTEESDWQRLPEVQEIYHARLSPNELPNYQKSVEFLDSLTHADFARTGINSLYASILISAWTAFESLAADVWERALNVCPIPLADRIIRGQPQVEGTSEGKSAKFISLEKLREARYDLKNQMGMLLLRRWRRVDFNSLKGIRAAYDTAFEKATDAVFEGWPAHKIVHVLEAVRNLFAHRGGVADAQFIRRVRSYKQFEGLTEGDALALDGNITANLAASGISCAAGLLKFVDEWLTREKTAV